MRPIFSYLRRTRVRRRCKPRVSLLASVVASAEGPSLTLGTVQGPEAVHTPHYTGWRRRRPHTASGRAQAGGALERGERARVVGILYVNISAAPTDTYSLPRTDGRKEGGRG